MKTLDEVRKSEKDCLIPSDVAPLLGCNPYSINVQAKQDKERLGFPVIMLGERVKIPREGFIAFFEGRNGAYIKALNEIADFLMENGYEQAANAVAAKWQL